MGSCDLLRALFTYTRCTLRSPGRFVQHRIRAIVVRTVRRAVVCRYTVSYGFSDCDPDTHARPEARPSSFLPSFDRCPFPGTIPVRGHIGRRDKRSFDRFVSPVDYSDLPTRSLISFFVVDQKPQRYWSIVVIVPPDDYYCYYSRGHERFAGYPGRVVCTRRPQNSRVPPPPVADPDRTPYHMI